MGPNETTQQPTNAQTITSAQTSVTEPEAAPPEPEKRFTQSEVDNIVKERLKRAERAAETAQTEEINARRADLTQRENRLECREYLLDSGYNPELLNILDTADPEQFKRKASQLQRLIDTEKRKAQPKAPPRSTEPSGFGQTRQAFDRNSKHTPKSYPPVYDY